MARLVWTDPALKQLQTILDYISADSPDAAFRFAERIFDKTGSLEQFPGRGQVVPEFGLEDLRELVFGSHRVLYQVRGDGCFIVAVLHGSRDLLQHFDPRDIDDQ